MQTTDVRPSARAPRTKKEGFALLMALIAIAILSVLVTDLHETTSLSLTAATAERDMLRAEYLAKSGVNLTRMLIGQEKNIRPLLALPYNMMFKKKPPQLPVWKFADAMLRPFANYDSAKTDMGSLGVDVEKAEGLGKINGTFEVTATSESGKININDVRFQDPIVSQYHVAGLLYTLFGGFQPSPNKLDPLFTGVDEKGNTLNRLDAVASVVDWWDQDELRANYDPTTYIVKPSGSEDTDFYREQPDPYRVKNAPLDTLEELRLTRGMTDDIWSTFVEPDPEDPSLRQLTIYGNIRINPNEADPQVILARVCSFEQLQKQPLCGDSTGLERTKFVTILNTARSYSFGVPLFTRGSDFVAFLSGQPESLYGQLASLLGGLGGGGTAGASAAGGAKSGAAQSMLFTPMVLEQAMQTALRGSFGTTTHFFTINVTGRAGNSQRRISTVINTDPQWTPPKPNAGRLPPLGIFAYYRLD
jgi:general secretion pathway protein K